MQIRTLLLRLWSTEGVRHVPSNHCLEELTELLSRHSFPTEQFLCEQFNPFPVARDEITRSDFD